MRMKRFILLIMALLCFSPSCAHGRDWKEEASLLSERQLDGVNRPMWFLVSQISKNTSWCITVTTDDAIKLRRCDFNAANKNQLWSQTSDDKVHSALDNRKCMDFSYDSDLVRLEDCDISTEFAGFSSIGPIKEVNDERYCLTNRGVNPNPGDPILAKKCLDRPDYKWEVVPASSIGDARQVLMIRGSSGCLQPRRSRHVYLDECNKELAWHYELLLQTEDTFLVA